MYDNPAHTPPAALKLSPGPKTNGLLIPRNKRLEDLAPTLFSRLVIALVSVLILGFLVWANALPLKTLTTGEGTVLPDGFARTVQHLEGGTVVEVSVVEDAPVAAGQVIAVVDQTEANQELARLEREAARLDQTIERLNAIAQGQASAQPYLTAPGVDADSGQAGLHSVQREVAVASLARLDARIQSSEGLARSLELRLDHAREEFALLAASLERREELMERGLARLNEIEAVQRDALRARTEIANVQSLLDQEQLYAMELRAERDEVMARLREAALLELEERYAERDRVQTDMARLAGVVERSEIRAPIDGVVHQLAIRAPAVLAPGGMVAEIVPTDQRMFAEIQIAPRDIAQIEVGAEVSVEVTAYDRTRFGTLDGIVDTISPSALIDGNGDAFFRVRVRFEANAGRNGPLVVSPGMAVFARIVTGERTLMQYLLKPIHELLASPLSEA